MMLMGPHSEKTDIGMFGSKMLRNGRCEIGGIIIHYEQFLRLEGLLGKGFQTPA